MAVLIPFRTLCSCCFLFGATADWVVEFSSTGEESVGGVALDSAANPIVVVSSSTALVSGLTLVGQEDIFVLKYDDAGTLQSQWSFGTTSKDVASCMTVDSSDNIFVAGSTEGDWPGQSQTNTFGFSNIVLFKLDSAGSQQWAVQLDVIANVYSVAVDSAQNVILGGNVFGDLAGFTSAGGGDLAVFKFDSTGTQLWAFQIGTSLSETPGGLAVDSSDNIIMCGSGSVDSSNGDTGVAFDGNTVYGDSDIFVFKLTSTGSKAWSDQIGGSGTDYAGGVAVDSSENVYVTGTVSGQLLGATSQGAEDVCVIKYDTNGVRQWVKQIGTNSFDIGGQIVIDSDTLYISGSTFGDFYGTNAGGSDYFVARMDTTGHEISGEQYGTDNSETASFQGSRTTLTHDASGNIYSMGTVWGLSSFDAFLWKIETTTTTTIATSTATSRTTTTVTTATSTIATDGDGFGDGGFDGDGGGDGADGDGFGDGGFDGDGGDDDGDDGATDGDGFGDGGFDGDGGGDGDDGATDGDGGGDGDDGATDGDGGGDGDDGATDGDGFATSTIAGSTGITTDPTTTPSASTTSSEAEEQVLSAQEVEALETQRKEQAAAAVAAVDAAVDAAVQQALMELFSGNGDTSNPAVLGEVLIQSPVGPVKVAAFSEAKLAAAGGVATVGAGNESADGASATLEVNSALLGEVGGSVLLSASVCKNCDPVSGSVLA